MESSLTNFTHGTAVEVRTMDKFQPGQVWAGLSWVYRCVLGGGGGGKSQIYIFFQYLSPLTNICQASGGDGLPSHAEAP